MAWVKRIQYTDAEIDKAGDILINDASSEDEKNKAIDILDHWRAIHSYPMHVFNMRLRKLTGKTALNVQRLKRVPAILSKLDPKRIFLGRTKRIKLSEMQDIGGCRTVLSNVNTIRKLSEKYSANGNIKHKLERINDYIKTPKSSGYRSFHMIYRFFSDKGGKQEYNGLLVEIQLRSKLQHLWATTVEIVGFFTGEAIKSNEGKQEWKDFFILLSSAFAKMENCPIVPKTPSDEKELYLQIKAKEQELGAIKKIEGWTQGVKIFTEAVKEKPELAFFLLELDIAGEKTNITGYTQAQEQKAIEAYSEMESKYRGKKGYDIVLVGADSTADLKKAYPNYFLDANEFLKNLKQIIAKY